MVDNVSALSSSIYNPGYDDIDLQIYNTISNNMSDSTYQELLKKYTNVFYNMSSVNEYEGVFQNPATCDINESNADLSSLLAALESAGLDPSYTDPSNPDSLVSQITGGNSTTSTVSSDDILDVPDGVLLTSNGDGSYTATNYTNNSAIQPSMAYANNYFNMIIGNLPVFIALAQSSMGLLTALGNSNTPCSTLSNFFGSLTGLLNDIMSDVKSLLKKIIGLIAAGVAAVLDEIESIISQIKNLISSLISQISSEIKNFIKSLIDSIRLGLGNFLKNLKLDPCLSSILKSVGTSSTMFIV